MIRFAIDLAAPLASHCQQATAVAKAAVRLSIGVSPRATMRTPSTG